MAQTGAVMPTFLPSLARRTPSVFLLAALAAAAACSSSSASTGSGTTTTAASTGAGGTTTSSSSTTSTTGGMGGASSTSTGSGGTTATTGAGAGMVCPPSMTYGGGEATISGTTATAKIVDETGAPVPSQPVYICGINICSDPGMTSATGSVTISSDLMMKKPAFKFGDALNYAELAIPLAVGTTDFTMGGTAVLATGKLSDKPGATLTPGADATSGDVTVSVPAGGSVSVNDLVFCTPSEQELRTVSIPIANVGPVLDPVMVNGMSADFALLYGLAPSGTLVCPAVKVTVALPANLKATWTAGTAVEFWIMTVDTGQTYAPYAGWAKMSDGVVNADGTVSTVAGQGFIDLENFAIRLK
jgi:hypothetical protein